MNAAQLPAAADKLARAANLRTAWATQAHSALRRALFTEVARQLRDRADQTRSWAKNVSHYQSRGEAIPTEVEAQIESAVREFLQMVGPDVNDA